MLYKLKDINIFISWYERNNANMQFNMYTWNRSTDFLYKQLLSNRQLQCRYDRKSYRIGFFLLGNFKFFICEKKLNYNLNVYIKVGGQMPYDTKSTIAKQSCSAPANKFCAV